MTPASPPASPPVLASRFPIGSAGDPVFRGRAPGCWTFSISLRRRLEGPSGSLGRDGGDVPTTDLRRVVLFVALLNLGYFGVEFAVALAIGSVSLFADSIDFLEDTSINFLILRRPRLDGPQPCAGGHGPCRHPARAGPCDALDGLGEI